MPPPLTASLMAQLPLVSWQFSYRFCCRYLYSTTWSWHRVAPSADRSFWCHLHVKTSQPLTPPHGFSKLSQQAFHFFQRSFRYLIHRLALSRVDLYKVASHLDAGGKRSVILCPLGPRPRPRCQRSLVWMSGSPSPIACSFLDSRRRCNYVKLWSWLSSCLVHVSSLCRCF